MAGIIIIKMLTSLIRYTFSQASYKIVMVRHGESIWNKEKKWAGWTDIPLSSGGIKQAKQCAKLIKKQEINFDEVYTSVLTRTIRTSNYILDELNMHYLPVHKEWRLNEKHYGSLQGENKVEINEKYGSDLVSSWRRSFDVPPPPLDIKDSRHPSKDPRYKDVDPALLPSSECLSQIIARLRPLFEGQIIEKIKEGRNLLVVGHGSSLRALVFLLDPNKSEDEIKEFNIPTAVPIICTLDSTLQPISYEFLGDEVEIQSRMQKIKYETQKNPLNQ